MKVYVLDQRKDNTKHNAVGKAMTDVFEIFGGKKIKTMPGVPKDAKKIFKVFDLIILAFYSIVVLSKKDYCIFIYHDNAQKIKLLSKLKKIRKFTTVCMVNDVNSIRSDGLFSEKRKSDIDNDFALISSADIIMAPNEGSIEYMKSRGITNKMIPVKVWDYLMDEEMGKRCDSNVDELVARVKSICEKNRSGDFVNAQKWKVGFAGNLGKSEFISNIGDVYDENVEYCLWGDCENKTFDYTNVIYKGSVSPNVLPLELSANCNFGLVWDGVSSTSVAGGYGEYLRFNNSHKCGCYLASGIPVFVWKESGMAHFVNETGCGYAIESMADIATVLNGMTMQEYERLLTNTRTVSRNIREGYYLSEAVDSVIGG